MVHAKLIGMKRLLHIRKVILIPGCALAVAGCVSHHERVYTTTPPPVVVAGGETVVSAAPPPMQPETVIESPGPGYVWINGYWRWRGGNWHWENGHWVRPPHEHAEWVPPKYYHQGDRDVWTEGTWR